MRYYILSLFFALVLFTSCGKSKKDGKENEKAQDMSIISPKKMGHIMTDVFLAESAIMSKQIQYGDARYYSIKYYNYIFAKNNISHAQFEQNFSYYTSHSEDMLKVMSNVVDSLNLLQSKVYN